MSKINQAPKFVIIKKQMELTTPLNKISVNLKCLIKRPSATAIAKEI